jgi:hypothetical protein
MDDYLAILRREFEADEGSFLLGLRVEAEWDREAFSRLIGAMERCASEVEGREVIERWIANGFWFLEKYTAEWAGHPNRIPTGEEDYYRTACTRLSDLAWWLFFGESPYEGDGPLPPL